MNGLLDIWDEWKNQSGWFKDSSSNLESIARGSDTINRNQINRGRKVGITSDPMKSAIDQSGRTEIARQNVDQELQKKGLNQRSLMLNPKAANAQIEAANKNMASSTQKFHPSQGDLKYHGGDQQDQLKWWQTLSNKIGFDYDKAAATWKDKGGFEGLMANPAFTMGLAFMQAGAEGKNIGQGALDNVMKAAGISSHYKKILKDRAEEPIQATAADMAEVEDLLGSINIKEGNWLENAWSKFKGGNPGAEWSMAVEEIALKYQEKVRAKQKALAKAGKPQTLRRSDQIKIMQELIDSGVIKKKKSLTGGILTAHSLAKPMAEGGPVESGKPYLVGEKGPEVIIPRSDGNVIANDDSQIFAMLLASNPQLQNVSRQRAERILRSRFPEYFE